MKKLLKLLLFQIAILSLFSCSKALYYQSNYQSSNFKLNEFNAEWQGGTLSNTDQGLVYGLTNDENYLYVKLKVVGQQNQVKILMNGLILWFDTGGKSKKKLGFAFPLINEKARAENRLVEMSGDDPEMKSRLQSLQIEPEKVNNRFLNEEEAINVISEDGKIKETIESHRNEEGINIMLYMDKYKILYYEARIPLTKIFGEDMTSQLADIPAFSYGFEIGELKLGILYQTYLTNPIAYRNAQRNRSLGLPGSSLSTSDQHMFGVAKIRQKAIEVWVKQAKLSQK